jgi:hypothetical protein
MCQKVLKSIHLKIVCGVIIIHNKGDPMKLKTKNKRPKRNKRKKMPYVPMKPESILIGLDPNGEKVKKAVPDLKNALADADPVVRLFAKNVLKDVRRE